MNTCCGSRTHNITERTDGILVTVLCTCKKFIASQLFEKMHVAVAWAKHKIAFEKDLINN